MTMCNCWPSFSSGRILRRILRELLVGSVLGAVFGTSGPLWAQGTAFTYQGRLLDGGAPANGSYDLRFGLSSTAVGGSTALEGSSVAGPVTNTAVPVSAGLFQVVLDFGAAFNGTPMWLEIGVRTNGSTAGFTPLSPPQPVAPVPTALYSSQAGVALLAKNVVGGVMAANGIATNLVLVDPAVTGGNFTNATLQGNGQGLTISAANLQGTVPVANLSGITSNQIAGPTDAAYRSGISNRVTAINVRDFGAVGDGLTDDTVAISNAWTLFISGPVDSSGTLYFPAGIYLDNGQHYLNWNSVPNISRPNLRIVGEGPKSVWRCLSTTGFFIQTVYAPLDIEHITLQGPGQYTGKIIGYFHDGPSGVYQFNGVSFVGWSWYGHLADDSYNVHLYDVMFFFNHIGLGMGYKCDAWTVEGKFGLSDVGVEMGADTAVAVQGSTNLNNHPAGTPLISQSARFRFNAMYNTIGMVIGGSSANVDVSGYSEGNTSFIQIGHDPTNSWWPYNAIEYNYNPAPYAAGIYVHDLGGLYNEPVITAFYHADIYLARNAMAYLPQTTNMVLLLYGGTNSTISAEGQMTYNIQGINGGAGTLDSRREYSYGRSRFFFGRLDWDANWYARAGAPFALEAGAGDYQITPCGAFRSGFWPQNDISLWASPVSSVAHVKTGPGSYALVVSNATLNVVNGNANISGGMVTNNGLVWLSTGGAPTNALPNGSIATSPAGLFVRQGDAWIPK